MAKLTLSSWPITTQESEVVSIWRGNGRLDSTMIVYLRWVRRFHAFCETLGKSLVAELTWEGMATFAQAYASEHRIDLAGVTRSASHALSAWFFGLRALGHTLPEWKPASHPIVLPPLLQEYIEYRRLNAGVTESTLRLELDHIPRFLKHVCGPGRELADIRLEAIDQYILALTATMARKTVARVCSSLRVFLRFLHATGRLSHDLATSVAAPISRAGERPPRTMPWDDLRKLLQVIDTSRAVGRRDYALLLMMATYGMGAGEALSLKLEDIDWIAGTLHVVRPKTGMETYLPLLPAIGEALANYLMEGRPRHTAAREIFIGVAIPHCRLSPAAICHVLRKYAKLSGIKVGFLGSHVLRHSHATFQIEQGASPKVVSDILGHREPNSTSTYVRVATTRLRALALPVPL